MKIWIPRLIVAAFAMMLAYAIYWGYHKVRKQEPEVVPAAASALNEGDRQLIRGYNEFGKALYMEAAKDKPAADNIFLSPYSVAAALSMVYNGASGTAAEEIARVLRFPTADADREMIGRSALAVLETSVQNTKQTELRIANSMWMKKDWNFSKDVLDLTGRYYKAELQTLDFTSPSASTKMNNWVKKQTNDKISRMVEPPINSNVISILLNAVYFRGEWTAPFEENRTSSKPFKREDGSKKQVPLMEHGDTYNYFESDEVQAVRLPYGNRRLGMNVYVPGNKTGSIGRLVEWLLQDGGLDTARAGLKDRRGIVAIPRFKVEYAHELKDILIRMGLKKAFDMKSNDLNSILESPPPDGNVYISKVIHKTFLEVNEKGTEAAAATKVELEAGSAPPAEEPFHFVADRPFFLTIEDRASGLILFMGTVKEP